jgi:D-alanine-D-alanine ligase
MPTTLEIAVICGGPSTEHEVSLRTAAMVIKNLDRKKYKPTLIVIKKNGLWKFGLKKSIEIGRAVDELKAFDFAFVAMHGVFGEDGRIQALLEWIGAPYSGSGVLSSAMAMDKGISNDLYRAIGMHVPRYAVLNKNDQKKKYNFEFPAVVKPIDGGSSVGVSIVRSKKELQKGIRNVFNGNKQVMIQKFIEGREFTCGMLEDKNGKAFALPPTEIIPKTSKFFDYKAKYNVGGSQEITPANLSKPMTKKLQAIALKAHAALGCSGMSRSDFILKGSTFYILETNTIPGMTQTSLLPQAAKAAGIEFSEMLDLIIFAGLRRHLREICYS